VIRNMSLLLRPSMLDDFGLASGSGMAGAGSVQARRPARSRSGGRGPDQLPDEHKTCIYRVVQEALHNCARHSQVRSVRVQVRQEPLKIVLSVEDDGRGFDARRADWGWWACRSESITWEELSRSTRGSGEER
jgi:signal transduction histidine kinase